MVRRSVITLALAIAWSLTGMTGAYAGTYRVPATGRPALVVVDPPDAWSVWINPQAAILLGAKDGSDLVQLMLVSDPNIATKTEADMAAEMLQSFGASSSAQSTPDSIGDAAGTTFIGRATKNGTPMGFRLTLVRLAPTQVVLMLETTREPLTQAQIAARTELAGHISLIR